MFTTPRKNREPSTPRTYTPTKRLNGLFEDGIWQCNCNPRLPAAHFQVKKDGPNHGKWFYTCQEPRDSGDGCGFFLWDEKAKAREMGAVIGNTRSEPEEIYRKREMGEDKATDRRTIEGHAAASNKWMEELGRKDEDEFGEWALSVEDERSLVSAVEEEFPGPETPRKAVKTNAFATPGSGSGVKRKREDETNGLPTPAKSGGAGRDEDVFGTGAGRIRGHMWDGNERARMRSPSATPTPSRYHDPINPINPTNHASSTTSESQTSQAPLNTYDLTPSILSLLSDSQIDDETETALRALLSKHALRISGIAKGRDISREALRSKDGVIAELKQKIEGLEAERDMDRRIIRHFKEDMKHSVEKRRGGGRGRGT